MSAVQFSPSHQLPTISWEKLPDDFILPDDPVDNNLQPLLAAALRESLALAGLILESMLIATNFGLCATVGDKTIVKAPDWVYVTSVQPIAEGDSELELEQERILRQRLAQRLKELEIDPETL